MRVLFVSAPLLGHLNPMLPLARAVQAAGHEVRVATGGDALAGLPPGVEGVDVAPGFAFTRTAQRTMLRHPLIARRELAGNAGTRGVSLLFGAVNDALAPHVRRAAREWAPDVVVHEPLAVAGALAAADLGVPAVVHGTGFFDGADLARVTTAALPRRRGAGVPPPALVLAVAPPSVAGAHEGRAMRPVPHSADGDLPDRLATPATPERPRILVSRSTVAGPGGGGDLMGAVVAAAGGVDADVVLVRPPAKLVARGLPGNVTAVDRIPLAPAIAAASAVVHHGGAGTALEALTAGVPQLLTPGPGDRRRNAELVAARGAGLAVRPRDITTAHLRALVADSGLRAAAGEVRDEVATMPHPRELVPAVVETRRAG
jgi:UDP:flavonoid glycosyltransferase YjiC (YdhE family)